LKVSAGALAGLAAAGDRFCTQAPVRFGLVTDSHYADADPVGARFYRESLAKMREAVTILRGEKVSFLGILGDIKDMAPKEPEARTLAHLAAIEAEIQRFGGPTYHVLGNHDMDNLSKPQVLAGITNTGIPRDRSYYAFGHQGLRFIVLDACYLGNDQPYDHGNFDYRNTWVPADELAWLDRELTASVDPVIVLAHQRLDAEGPLHVNNSADVRAVLERSKKVLAVFMGHDHPGAYNQVNGIHYYTQKAIVEGSGEAQNAYTIVTVDPVMNITVTGYRMAVSKDLPKRGEGSWSTFL
jgi:metallophosphoesterase superfamily enzyme